MPAELFSQEDLILSSVVTVQESVADSGGISVCWGIKVNDNYEPNCSGVGLVALSDVATSVSAGTCFLGQQIQTACHHKSALNNVHVRVVWGFRLPSARAKPKRSIQLQLQSPRNWELSYEAQLSARHFRCRQEAAQKTKNAVACPSLD